MLLARGLGLRLAVEQRLQISRASWISFGRGPARKFLIRARFPRPRLDFKTNDAIRPCDDRMPNARRQIHAPSLSLRRFHAQPVTCRDITRVVEHDQIRSAFQNQKRFRFGRIGMPMRTNIGTWQQHVQKSMWIILRTFMKVVVYPPPRGSRRLLCHTSKQHVIDNLHRVHIDSLRRTKVAYLKL